MWGPEGFLKSGVGTVDAYLQGGGYKVAYTLAYTLADSARVSICSGCSVSSVKVAR